MESQAENCLPKRGSSKLDRLKALGQRIGTNEVSCPKTSSAPGPIAAGSFRATRPLKKRPPRSWTSTRVSGRANPWLPRNASSLPTKRPASKPVVANNRPCPQDPIGRRGWNTNTSGWERGRTWRPGMCGEPRSTGAVSGRWVSHPSTDSSSKSWPRALSICAPRLLDPRQLLLSSRPALPTAAPDTMAQHSRCPHPCSCQLA